MNRSSDPEPVMGVSGLPKRCESPHSGLLAVSSTSFQAHQREGLGLLGPNDAGERLIRIRVTRFRKVGHVSPRGR